MPSFTPLDADSERQVRLMRLFQRKSREFAIRKHLAEAAIQIADAIVPRLSTADPGEARMKGRLLASSSSAYARLANHPTMQRLCALRVQKAVQKLKDMGIS